MADPISNDDLIVTPSEFKEIFLNDFQSYKMLLNGAAIWNRWTIICGAPSKNEIIFHY